MVADADLSGGTIATYWTDVGSPTTTEYDTTAANMLFGTQALHVAVAAADEGLTSNNIPVTEGENIILSCFVKCTTADVKVQLYNVTGSEEIESATVDEPAWTEVRFADSIPDDCENAAVRFLGPTSTSEFYVSGPIILQSRSGRAYVAPSWFTREEQLVDALELPQGFTSEDTYSYMALSRGGAVSANRPSFLRDDRGLNPLMIEFRAHSQPVIFAVQRTFAELSANTSTTPCDREYVKWKTLANILYAHGDDGQAWRCARNASELARTFGYGMQETRVADNPTATLYSGVP